MRALAYAKDLIARRRKGERIGLLVGDVFGVGEAAAIALLSEPTIEARAA